MLNNPQSAGRLANGLVSALYLVAALLLAMFVYAIIQQSTNDTVTHDIRFDTHPIELT